MRGAHIKEEAPIWLFLWLPEGHLAADVLRNLVQGLVPWEHTDEMVSGPQHGVEGHVDQLLRGCNNDLLCADCLVERTDLPPQGWCALRVCVAQAQVLPPATAMYSISAEKPVPRPQHGMECHVDQLLRSWHKNILCAHLLLEPRLRLSHLPQHYDGVSGQIGHWSEALYGALHRLCSGRDAGV